MVLLGVDPGFQYAGFGIVEKTQGSIIVRDYGYLRLDPKKTLVERTGLFHTFFDAKIKEYGVTHLSLETPFLGKNAQNFLKLGYLRGILYLLASHYKLSLNEFAPREVKVTLTGFGGASKEQVARVIERLFPRLKPDQRHDVTDALAVTLCGVWQSSNPLASLLKR